jgi:hypothetical protein
MEIQMKKFFINKVNEAWSLAVSMSKDPSVVIPYVLGALFNILVIIPAVTHATPSLIHFAVVLALSMAIMPLMIFMCIAISVIAVAVYHLEKLKRENRAK